MGTDHVEAINRVKHRYFRAVDAKDADALRRCFTADATLDYGPGSAPTVDAMVAGYGDVARDPDGGLLVLDAHLGLHPEIELVSDREATGTWVLQFRRVDRAAGTEMVLLGDYRDEYVLDGDAWKIRSCVFRSTWGRITPLPPGTVFM